MMNGPELPILYVTGALVVLMVGPREYSLDYALGLDSFFRDALSWIVLAFGVLGAVGALALRHKPEQRAGASEHGSAVAR
jgi:hypothetical protein